MKKAEYARMAERESSYWWHVGRLKIIATYLKLASHRPPTSARVLNIGCGTGGTVSTLERFGAVDNVDVSDEAIAFMKSNGYKNAIKVDGNELPYENVTFDLVGAFDVLEHIDDQTGALKEWYRVLKPDGAVVLTVPAYQWLWSEHDVSLHHKRRYTISRLVQAAQAAGFKVEKKSYAIVFSLPLVAGFRLLNGMLRRETSSETSYVNVPDFVNRLFISFLGLEARIHRYLRFPFGTTVVAILRKSETSL